MRDPQPGVGIASTERVDGWRPSLFPCIRFGSVFPDHPSTQLEVTAGPDRISADARCRCRLDPGFGRIPSSTSVPFLKREGPRNTLSRGPFRG